MEPPSVSRRVLLAIAAFVALLLIAAPAFGANPSAKPERGDKGDQGSELSTTLTGTIASSEDAKGRATFTMTVGGVTWELSAGPRWYWGAKNPLAAFVGKSVEVTGTYHAGQTDLDVSTVDGKALRSAGKPPWAGGPKVVGKIHPGGKDGTPGHGHGRADAPGQLKDKSAPAVDD